MEVEKNILKEIARNKMHFTRIAILLYLAAKGEVTFKELYKELGLSPGNAWGHLEKLEREGLVTIRRVLPQASGSRVVVNITYEGMKRVEELLRMFKALVELGYPLSSAGESTKGPQRDQA